MYVSMPGRRDAPAMFLIVMFRRWGVVTFGAGAGVTPDGKGPLPVPSMSPQKLRVRAGSP